LIEQLHLYRQTLPIELAGRRFLLLLDGHTSRFTYDAINLLAQSGIDVLVFPAHCTHVIQPFDVCLGNPLKSKLKGYFGEVVIREDQERELHVVDAEPRFLADKRARLFRAFMLAWSDATREGNVTGAFRVTGLVPVDPNLPLTNKCTRRSPPAELYRDPAVDGYEFSSELVTSSANLDVLKGKKTELSP
jgi:hypothetical protein